MKQNIKNNKNYYINSRLYRGNYFDFMLSDKSTNNCNCNNNIKIIADFSILNEYNSTLYSNVIWDKSLNNGVKLENIGFTGIDNGLISYRKDRISNEQFLNIFLNSELNIKNDDKRFFMNPVTGNTLRYNFPITLNKEENYISFQGGFYQGFYKLNGNDYQVLPNTIENEISLYFNLRPRNDYNIDETIINKIHPNNNGIFFYIGTRAENKFWPYYNTNSEIMNEFKKEEYINNDYFEDGYYDDSNKGPCNKYFVDEEYLGEDIIIPDNYEYLDSNGHKNNEHGFIEVKTDNKFLMFDRTPTGYTTENWIDGTKVILTDKKTKSNLNYFLLINRTKTGYTVDTIDLYEKENNNLEYNVFNDVKNNAFALRINEKGAIGYKYLIKDCNSKNNFAIIEEYSKEGLIKLNEWNDIKVTFKKLNFDKMKIYFYINGFLIFISKTLDIFNFRALNDVFEKQEAVPYNISLGGGTLGLLETITPQFCDVSNYELPIEKEFCGTFLGDIKSFKIEERL